MPPTDPVSAGSVGLFSVVDTSDDDLMWIFAQSVQHPIGTAAGRPNAFELTSQRFAYSSRVGHQVVVRKSMTAVATASGSLSVSARRAGGVRTSS